MKITDPKTPYNDDDYEDASADNEMSKGELDNEPEIQHHLMEAKINRDKNAQMLSRAVDFSQLGQKLQEVKDTSDNKEESKNLLDFISFRKNHV